MIKENYFIEILKSKLWIEAWWPIYYYTAHLLITIRSISTPPCDHNDNEQIRYEISYNNNYMLWLNFTISIYGNYLLSCIWNKLYQEYYWTTTDNNIMPPFILPQQQSSWLMTKGVWGLNCCQVSPYILRSISSGLCWWMTKVKNKKWLLVTLRCVCYTNITILLDQVNNLLDTRKETLLLNFRSQFIVISVSVEKIQ